MFWQILGALAATLTMFSFLPQIVKSIKRRSVSDVSLVMLCQLSLGVFLWIVYGVYRRDPIIIIANLITLSSLLILLYLYFFFQRKA